MALFDVPGWSMPADVKPTSDGDSRKRKRAAGEDSAFKLQTAEVNMEKLMKKLTNEEGGSKEKIRNKVKRDASSAGGKGRRKSMEVEGAEGHGGHDVTKEHIYVPTPKTKRGKPKKRVRRDLGVDSSAPDALKDARESSNPKQVHPRSDEAAKPTGEKGKKKEVRKTDDISENATKSVQEGGADAHLTSLQSKMKQSLDGARFRWINETLYKSNSKDAERLMHEDLQVFEEYHAGFRHQVTSWPSNPVDHFIETLSAYPRRSVIVDLGCGDAALAQNLVPKGYTVLSYDFIAANSFIVAADICGKLPIPGSEAGEEGQVVDVVVCSLSLMSTNWLNCIREARRVLKKGGELKIAEVASRFTNVDKFTSVICSAGFRLVSKDERNSHFTLFDFKKTEDLKNPDDRVWQKILSRGDVLQPCEYKRR